jgi:hypothetical protein
VFDVAVVSYQALIRKQEVTITLSSKLLPVFTGSFRLLTVSKITVIQGETFYAIFFEFGCP